MALKVGQINAQRSAAAAASLELLMRELNLDILCLQEPFSYKGKVRGYNSPSLIKIQPQNSEKAWVAAAVNTNRVDVLLNMGTECDHIMCFKVLIGDLEFIIINVYCQYSIPLEGFLAKLERIINSFQCEKLLITMDANAKSGLWFDKITDEKGILLEEFVYENNLVILNKPNNPPTFMSGSGSSNIDITLATENFIRHVKSWKVDCSCTTSDHNLIILELEVGSKVSRSWKADLGYNTKKADWNKFGSFVERNFDDEVINLLCTLPADKAVSLFNKKLDDCCKNSIPKRRMCEKTVPWWNLQLTNMRKKVMAAKKQLIRAMRLHLDNVYNEYASEYKKLRNEYVSQIRKQKKETWQKFVEIEGNKDPWGIVHKIVNDKIGKPIIWTALQLSDGRRTTSLDGTIEALLNKCVPTDDSIESSDCRAVRQNLKEYRNRNLEPLISFNEVKVAIYKFKNKKAPGLDNFKIEIVKELWNRKSDVIYGLINNCFSQGSFPRKWKESNLKILLKNESRDRALINSYRPIALLSVIGKTYERIIVNRIQLAYNEAGLESPDQFGFRKGKGVDDAFLRLRRAIKFNDQKYTIAIFIDIEGAFDNLWWPAILLRLAKANCSSHMLNVIKSYFTDRKCIVQNKRKKYVRKMKKGCPQGSIIGPAAWVWCMDTLLNELRESFSPECAEFVAYADDLACVVKGNTRVELHTHSEKIVEILNKWCNLHKLKISESKTVAMLFKGCLDERRLAVIKVNGKNIKFVEKTKYLGVIVDKRLSFLEHAKYLRERITQYVFTIKRIAAERWGIKRHILNVLYGAVALPIVKHGAVLWYDAAQKVMVRRSLLALQRALLLLVTKACRTTSTVAMQVIAGAEPMDLVIVEEALRKRIKRNENTIWEEYEYRAKDTEQFQQTLNIEMERIRSYILDKWQGMWQDEIHGRNTYNFLPEVTFAIQNKKWFILNRFATYLITGYGPINSTLHNRGILEISNCPMCGEENETTDHIIFDCVAYQSKRWIGMEEYRNRKDELIRNEQMFLKFNEFAKYVFERRLEMS